MLLHTCPEIQSHVQGHVGYLSLQRPQALNALSLAMVRALSEVLQAWQKDPQVHAVALRGVGKDGPFGVFCAGGDIRFLYHAALAGDAALEDFFTEEYALNYLLHHYPKPLLAFMDGIVMGGGMGLSQGASCRIVTECSRLAMPETLIGLFPDVGGGYFLSRCPGRTGEWLALTGAAVQAKAALELGLADVYMAADKLPQAWDALPRFDLHSAAGLQAWTAAWCEPAVAPLELPDRALIERYFSLPGVPDIVHALEASAQPWAQETAALLRQRSPLMLHVTLAQIRRARQMSLAEDLRLARDLMHHCFQATKGKHSEALEGIRARVIDKDRQPRWQPAHVEDVSAERVASFFCSPWPVWAHPLRALAAPRAFGL
jgi:enoyl-CoA hydratase